MFEIGQRYRFHMIVAALGEWTSQEFAGTVAATEGTLVKVQLSGGPDGMIINTGSWGFVRAEPDG